MFPLKFSHKIPIGYVPVITYSPIHSISPRWCTRGLWKGRGQSGCPAHHGQLPHGPGGREDEGEEEDQEEEEEATTETAETRRL